MYCTVMTPSLTAFTKFRNISKPLSQHGLLPFPALSAPHSNRPPCHSKGGAGPRPANAERKTHIDGTTAQDGHDLPTIRSSVPIVFNNLRLWNGHDRSQT